MQPQPALQKADEEAAGYLRQEKQEDGRSGDGFSAT
jgi:hypothetical protein